MKTKFETPGDKLWLMSVLAVLGLIVVLIFSPTKHQTRMTNHQAQTQTVESNTTIPDPPDPSLNAGESIYMKLLKQNTDPATLPMLIAGLTTYNEHCAKLDNTVMGELLKMKDEMSDADLTFGKHQVLLLLGSRGPEYFCNWFRLNVVNNIDKARKFGQ